MKLLLLTLNACTFQDAAFDSLKSMVLHTRCEAEAVLFFTQLCCTKKDERAFARVVCSVLFKPSSNDLNCTAKTLAAFKDCRRVKIGLKQVK